MDKFDESIKRALKTITPSNDFVDTTMQRINNSTPHRRRQSKRNWLPVLVGSFTVIVLVFLILPLFGKNHSSLFNIGSSRKTSTETAQNSNLPAGTSDAALASDLNTINNQINNENTDQNSANSALNDSSREITVPTD